MSQPSRIAFILHGKHCPNGLPEALLRPFRQQFDIDVLSTTSADSATRLAFEAANAGARWIIAAGGDGTVHQVVNGLMQLPSARRQETVLGVLPTGTGNDFARSLGSSRLLENLLPMMAAGHVQPLDLIRVRQNVGRNTQDSWCNNIGSVGITSDIVRRVKRLPSRLPAAIAFYTAVSTALLRHQPQIMQLTLDGQHIEGRFLCVSVANGRYFGSGLGIAPDASLNDGLMDIVLIRDANSLDFLRLLPRLRQAQHLHDPRVTYLRGRQLTIHGHPAHCSLELDGELCGNAPAEFSIAPASLSCLMRPPR